MALTKAKFFTAVGIALLLNLVMSLVCGTGSDNSDATIAPSWFNTFI
jgi:hypothetical protein